jgi:hypothetical protein
MEEVVKPDPLWRVMDRAYWRLVDTSSSCSPPENEQWRLVIEAVADWFLPKELPPHGGMRPGGSDKTYQETLSVQRQQLRAVLLAEAKRAGGGE